MKILCLVNAHALAHVSRTLEVAKVLRQHQIEIIFAGFGNYLPIAEREGFETREVEYVPLEQLLDAIHSEQLQKIYRKNQIETYIQKELALYEELKPDLVILDNRLTGATSTEVAGLKNIAIVNVHMSPFRQIPFYNLHTYVGSHTKWARILDKTINWFEFQLYNNLMVGEINQWRKEHDLKPLFSYAHECGQINLFPDIPEFNPVSNMPSNSHYVGPLTWHNSLPAPQCLSKIDPAKKCIYFSLGSTSLESLLKDLTFLSKDDWEFIVAVGHAIKDGDRHPIPNVHLEEYVNVDLLLPHCHLMLCHGGNGTIYQALKHGVPIVGVSTHAEQHQGLKRVNELRIGRGFTLGEIEEKGLKCVRQAMTEVIENPEYKTNALKFKEILRHYDGPKEAARIILDHVGKE